MASALRDPRLALLAWWGVALTVAVVAASVLLRLGTVLDAGGNASSRLPEALEKAVRLAHRVSASGAGLFALAVVAVAAAKRRALMRVDFTLVAAIVLLTVLLAALGRHTPGYRLAGITVANAWGGVGLACAFLWLRLRALRGFAERDPGIRLAVALALAAVLAEGALGTAASAYAMHGERFLDPIHVSLGPVVAAIAVAAVSRARDAAGRGIRAWVYGVVAAQMAIGFALAAAAPGSGTPSAWFHATLACALALALTACAARER